MKFVSWNVNGLRACIQKGFLDVFNEMDADFFCLQETKLSAGQLELNMPGYEQYWCYAEKKGYSGTAIFTKHTPLSVFYGIGREDLDNEGRVITLEYREFWLVTCYTPNAQRGLARIDHRMAWDEAFRAYLRQLDESKPVILCGDLNVAHQEIDLKNPASNRGNAGFSDQERESFGKTLDLGFTDTFRHLYPDATGKYTWWSYMYHARENNAGWRIDYFLVSDRLQAAINQAGIHSSVPGSDHCPVSLDLDTLVNGGIFSPSAGPATVAGPEPKPTKKTKASAPNAKAFAPLSLILILVLGVSVLWKPVSSLFPSSTNGPSEQYWWNLSLEVYYPPLSLRPVYLGLIPEYSITIPTTSLVEGERMILVTDGTNSFYVSSTDGLSDANVWMRLSFVGDAAKFFADGWTVNYEFTPVEGVDTGAASLTVIPYYSHEDTEMDGWLIWGYIPADLTVDISVGKDATGYLWSQCVSLEQGFSEGSVKHMTTGELVSYIASDSLLRSMVLANSPFGTDLADSMYSSMLYDCPALSYLEDREDAVDAIMNAQVSQEEKQVLYWLLNTSVYRKRMTPAQEVSYLTCNFPSYPFEVIDSLVSYDLNVSTDVLVRYLQNLTLFYECSSHEAICLLFETYYAESNPALAELLTREDALTELMNSALEYNHSAMYLIASSPYFLQLSGHDLTVFMEYAAVALPNHLDILLGTDISRELMDHMTTAVLVQYIINSATINDAFIGHISLGDDNDHDQIFRDNLPLQVLEKRPDAVTTLMNVSHSTDGVLIDLLLATSRLRSLMTPDEEVNYILKRYPNSLSDFDLSGVAYYNDLSIMSTDEIVLSLRSIEVKPILAATSDEARDQIISFMFTVSPILKELSHRGSEAIRSLMNVSPRPGTPLNTYLLSHEIMNRKMTDTQRELFEAGEYATAWSEETDPIEAVAG